MKARRTLRRRIVLVALCSAFSVAAVPLLVVGLARLRGVQRRALELQAKHRDVLVYLAKMHKEIMLLEMGAEFASAERLQGLSEEWEEAVEDLRDSFGRLMSRQPAYEEMQEEWAELAPVRHTGWARYGTDLGAFEGHLDSVCEAAEEDLALAHQMAMMFCGVGIAAAGIAFLLSLWVMLTVLSDVASESYAPEKLEKEVEELAESDQFKSRVKLLAGSECTDDAAGDWKLQLTRRFPGKRTHVCFEATASHNGKQIQLWGRRYKWAGYLKSFQRICFPAFGRATWRALCLMHNNGLGSPVPIVFKGLRAGPFKAGSIILMEHVGEVSSVRQFLKSDFCLLSRQEQDTFLQRLVAFLHCLHRLGIYGIKARYLHGKGLEDPDRMQLYLFDLDKVLIWASCPSLVSGILRGKDHRRLLREVEPALSRARMSRLREWLRHPPALDTPEP